MKRSELLVKILLLPFDYLAVILSFFLAYYLRGYLEESFLIPFTKFIPLAIGLALIWVGCFWLMGLYSLDSSRSKWDELFEIILGAFAAATLASSAIFFAKEIDFSRIVLVITTGLSIFLTLAVRVVWGLVLNALHRRGIGVRKVLVIGEGETTNLVISGLEAEADPSVVLVGVVTFDEFESSFQQHQPDEVIQSDPRLGNDKVAHIINVCEENGSIFRFIPNLFEIPAAKIVTTDIAGVPIVTLSVTAVDGWYAVAKRLLDIIGAVTGLVLISPVFILTAIFIKMDSEGTIFYKQSRVGRNGKEFGLLKFRSMRMLVKEGKLVHSDADTKVEQLKETQKNYKLENDPRITKIGHFIRKTSIDELPQLINVLRGELSLVGPRAYLRKELDSQLERHPDAIGLVRRLTTVRPGITGVWQVSGRSNIEFSERVAMDAYYATHANLLLDIKIIFQTVPVVIKGTGAM